MPDPKKKSKLVRYKDRYVSTESAAGKAVLKAEKRARTIRQEGKTYDTASTHDKRVISAGMNPRGLSRAGKSSASSTVSKTSSVAQNNMSKAINNTPGTRARKSTKK